MWILVALLLAGSVGVVLFLLNVRGVADKQLSRMLSRPGSDPFGTTGPERYKSARTMQRMQAWVLLVGMLAFGVLLVVGYLWS